MKINCSIKILLLLSGLIMSHTSQATISDPLVQGALKAIYSSTSGSGWTSSAGWESVSSCDLTDLDTTNDICVPCGAKGVYCDDSDNVVELNLFSNNLVGEIPVEIGNLSNLVRLRLYDNQLTGQIPSSIGTLTELVELKLFDNELEGAIPTSFGNLVKLIHLQLHDNKLSGQLPPGLGNLTELWNFYIKGNQFIGELPSDLDKMGVSLTVIPDPDPVSLDLKWNALYSSVAKINTFVNDNHVTAYEDSQTLAPTSFARSNKTIDSVSLTWDKFDTSPSTPGGYKILQSTTSANGPFDEIPVIDIFGRDINNYTVNNLDIGVNYWFKVCSYTSPHSLGNSLNTVVSEDTAVISKGVPSVTAINQFVDEQTLVTMTASASDDDGTITGYSWSQTSGPTLTGANALTGDTTSVASFLAPEVDAAGAEFGFRVVVTDNDGDLAFHDLIITVNNVLVAPSVTVGPNTSIDEGGAVEFTSNASDPNGTIVKYKWEQISGTSATWIDDASAIAKLTAPSINTASEDLLFKLTVTDNDGDTASDTVQLTVNNVIVAPTVNPAVANPSTIYEGHLVTINADANDANGNIVKYEWAQLSGPTDVPMPGELSSSLEFTAPPIDADFVVYEFSVTVTDDDDGTASAMVQVTVYNWLVPPTADAGVDQTVDEFTGDVKTTVSLSAIDSVDPNGSIVSYSWSQVSGANQVTLTPSVDDPAGVTFEAPNVEEAGDVLLFEVTVTDNDGQSATEQVQVTVNDVLINPNVDASDDDAVEGDRIVMYAEAFDVDGEIISYHWEQLLGTPVELDSADTASPSFIAPSTNSNRSIRLLFRVTVTDDDGLTDSALIYIIITKRNVIQVGGGGALGWPWLLLLAIPLLGRRYLK